MLNFGMIGCGSAAEIRGGLGINLSQKANLIAVSDINDKALNAYADKFDIELKRPCGSVLKINALGISVITKMIPRFFSR